MEMSRILVILALVGSCSRFAWASPNNTMSITPSATSGSSITASDENTRNNEISSKYNAHSHTDLSTMSGVNTFTIGDGTSGNKDYCEDSATDRCLRWNEASGLWTIQQNGATYNQIVVFSGTTGIASGNVLVSDGTGALVGLGIMTNGQLLIGDGSGAPTVATLTQGTGVTITNGAGSITIASSGLSSTIVSFTRSTSGSAAYTGMGFAPKSLEVLCDSSVADQWSSGVSDSAAAEATIFRVSGSVVVSNSNAYAVWLSDDTTPTNGIRASVTTLDADGFTLSWTVNGSAPTATCYVKGNR